MVASLKIQSGGAWKTVADGKLKTRIGSVWVSPSSLKIQVAGAWKDSGYQGAPAAPTGLAVNAWATHDAVSFKWVAGVGGAASASYEVMVRNAAGTTATTGANVVTKTDTVSPSVDFTEVVQGTKYNVYVRALASSGLYSAWVGPLQISMGKDATSKTVTTSGTRAWTSGAKSIVGYKDVAVGPVVPTTVVVQAIRYNVSETFSGVLSPYGSHSISGYRNSAEQAQFSWPSSSIDTTPALTDYRSNGGVQGLICRGTGWSTTPTGSYILTGTITVSGLEDYTYNTTTTTPAVANGYW